jgi:hypothetical protein
MKDVMMLGAAQQPLSIPSGIALETMTLVEERDLKAATALRIPWRGAFTHLTHSLARTGEWRLVFHIGDPG